MPKELVTHTVTYTHEVEMPPTDLPHTDRQPLESPWHRACMNLLIESVEVRLAGRKDFYAGGNMFIYYSARQARNRDYSGPDFFFVQGPEVEHDRERLYWAVWEENGRYPNLVIELSSPTTAKQDHTTRKELYERVFQTAEYFIYDPFTQVLEGWRLAKKRYRRIKPNAQGRFWCEELRLWLGTWRGEFQGHDEIWLRFYDAGGNVVPIRAEVAEAELARLRQELAARRPNGPTSPRK